MYVMTVTFRFDGPTADELVAHAAELAPQWATIPGCLEKTWLLDRAESRCGGVYKFVDEESLRAYLGSTMWQAVESDDQFSDFDLDIYEMMMAATAVTHGLPAGVAATQG